MGDNKPMLFWDKVTKQKVLNDEEWGKL